MSQQLIIVVGPDMCGKTEIARALACKLGIPYFKASSEHETYLHEQNRFIAQLIHADTRMVDFLKQTRYSVVFDRAWPCEFAYSLVFERETSLDALRFVDDKMADMGAIVIVCRRKSYVGIVDDIDPTTTRERLEKLDAAYVDFMKWTHCKTLSLYVDDECLERELHDIFTWMGMVSTECYHCSGEGDDGGGSTCRLCNGSGWVYERD
jgi:hypothetical protein